MPVGLDSFTNAIATYDIDPNTGEPSGGRDTGYGSKTTNQVSVGATATQIVAARAGRGGVIIVQHGTTDVFIGGAGVSATNGVLLPGNKGASITLPDTGAIFGITASGTQTVSYYEAY